MDRPRTRADTSEQDVVVMPLPRLALRDVGLRGVAQARAELERAKAVAARNRLRQGKEKS